MKWISARFFVSVAAAMSLLAPVAAKAQNAQVTRRPLPQAGTPAPVTPVLSRTLRDLAASVPQTPPLQEGQTGAERFEPELPHFPFSPTRQPDGAAQRQPGHHQPTPGAVNFEGIDSNLTVAPPDTEGRVGPNNYVQWVNLRFQFFDKSGTPLIPPVPGNILWSGFGGTCQTFNDGDPIAQYDRMADRWVLTQFAVGASPDFSHQCVAVSQTGDPLGSYYLYDFVTDSANFVDYPHWGMWNDNYYMTAHIFNAAGNAYLGQGLYIFDRTNMLVGAPAGMVPVNLATLLGMPNLGGMLPGDIDSILPPPPGSYEQLLAPGSPEIDGSPSPVLHQFTVFFDFSTNTGTLFTYPDISVSPFVGGVCGFSRNCVVQPPPAGVNDSLDAISDRLMYRVGYRNFGDHESVVLNHTVQNTADATGNTAAPRWYEIRVSGPADPNCPSGYPCLYQQSTYAPDLQNRWMGSVAMDASGGMALGYSESSLTMFPSIFVTGRLASDPLSTMGGEVSMVAGGGSQIGTQHRWGDYSSMTVDPVDGCTFWYTQEYEATSGSFNWSTRIGTFSFPGCTPEAQGTIAGAVTQCATGEPIGGALVTAFDGTNTFSTTTDPSGNYTLVVPPGSYTVSTSDAARLCSPPAPQGVSVAEGQLVTVDFCMSGSINLQFAGLSYVDGNGNTTISPNDCVALTVAVSNPGCADASGLYGTLACFRPDVIVNNGVAPYPNIGIVSPASNATPFLFSTGIAYDCSDIAFTLTMHNPDSSVAATIPFVIPAPCPVAPVQTFSGLFASAIANQGFETGDLTGWTVDGSSNPPFATNLQAHTGTFSAQLGNVNPDPEPTGDSALYQPINVPATGGILSFWAMTSTTDTITFDWQDAYIEDSGGTILQTIFHQCSTTAWTQYTVNLAPYAGTTIRLRFLVHQDGANDDTAMWVDDAVVNLTETAGRLGRNFPSDCAGKACPGPFGSGNRAYDEFSYTNSSGANACITVTLTPNCGNATQLQSVAYNGSFDPASYCVNYLGDIGPSPANFSTGAYGFEAPAGSTFLVNVNVVTSASATCNSYTGTVAGLFDLTPSATGICAPCPTIALSPGVPDGAVGIPYDFTLGASGGAGGYQFFVTSGALPPGLAMDLAGNLTGSPTAIGSFAFTVTATDSNGCSGSQAYVVAIFSGCGGAWEFVEPALFDAYGVAVTSHGTVAYTAGGYSFSQGMVIDEFSSYDTTTNAWTHLTSEPPGNESLLSSAVYSPINNKVYVFGGLDHNLNGTNLTQIYDVTTDSWSNGAKMPDDRSLMASGYYNGLIYLVGGYSTGNISPAFTQVWAYDPLANDWITDLDPVPAPVGFGGAGFGVINGHLIVAGGRDANDNLLTSVYDYDIAANLWSVRASMPTAENVPGSGVLHGKLWIYGGGEPFGPSGSPSLLPTRGSAPQPRTASGSQVFDPASNSWSSGPPLQEALSFIGGSGVGNNLIAVGGFNGATSTAHTEILLNSEIALMPLVLPNGMVGSAYSQQLIASGGVAPYAFTLTSGALPPGLTLSGTGLISGTPAAGGSYSFVVTVVDSFGCTASFSYTIVILCEGTPITVSPATQPNGQVGAFYDVFFSASGGTGTFTFSSSGSLPAGTTLNSATGELSGTLTTAGAYVFMIIATDTDGCAGSQTYLVTVSCAGINLSPATLPAGSVGTPYIQTISASGGSGGYVFSVSGGALPPGLSLDPNTGVLSGTPTAAGVFSFVITATDSQGCIGSSFYALTISCASISLSPATLPNSQVGTPYSQTITAAGGTGTFTFAITAGTLPAGLSMDAAGNITGTPTAVGSYFFTVTATDTNGCTGSQQYLVTVSCAAINLTPTSLPAGSVGIPYSQTISASGGSGGYVFSVSGGALPPGLSLDPNTGVLSGTPTAAGVFSFVITATDSQGCIGSSFYALTISCASISLSPATLPNAQLGTPYSQTVTAAGGTGSFTFAVAAGTLPAGLSMDAAGNITGTPTAVGSYVFTVTATDANGCTGSQQYLVTVSCAAISLSPATLPTGSVGTPYSQTITATGGAGGYTFLVTGGSLPAGLTLDPNTGLLSGTPASAGVSSFVVTATDAQGCFGSLFYTLTISCAAITVAPPSLPNAQAGVAYSAAVSASGGTGTFAFTVSSGALPAGLSLNAATGAITGTPAATGTSLFTITATDANGCTGSQIYVISVSCAAINLAPASLPSGTPGTPYSATVTATGGAAPYTFTLTGTLPPGLAMDAAGNITGTPTTLGGFTITVTATDASGCSGSILYTINILGITISSSSPKCGPAAGGTTVTIVGNNFQPGVVVRFLGVAGTIVSVTPTEIQVLTPTSAPGGDGDITITNPNGDSATLVQGWGYDFLDVPTGNPFHDFVCNLVRNGITAGCGGGNYCPSGTNLRNQMAVFIQRALHGFQYVPPPATGTMFPDVPANSFGAAFIEESAREGVMGVGEDTGCGAGLFCPTDPVTRLSMAYILLRGEHGGSYVPPAANCGTFPFVDVPCPSTDADWVSELVAEGITAGCDATHYCPTNPVTRAQMAVFMTVTFNLQ